MMKTVLILQQFGLGDQIFCQTIAHHFIERGYKVVWPVKVEFYEGLSRAYPRISWIQDTLIRPEIFEIKEKDEIDGVLIAPIRWSDSYMKLPYKSVMKAKYLMYDLDWKTWKDYAMWNSDTEKQDSLMKLLGIKYGDLYNFVNTRYTGHSREIEIEVNNGFRNVHMENIPGYSLFDWAAVISHSVEIHSVSTSTLFMFEMLPLAKPIHLYRRPNEADFSFVDYLFTKKYILHH